MKDIQILSKDSKYDFFLIISAVRFTETDIWLAKQIRSAKKNFYFVRTKLDQDLDGEQSNYPKTYNESNVRERIKEATVKGLKDHDFKDPKVYLISNNNQQLYDFPRLIIELANSLPVHKKEAMTLSIHSFSKEIILEKKKILKKKAYYWSGLSALGATVPVPGVSLTADIAIIMNEISNYRYQFGLKDDDLIKNNLSENKMNLIRKLCSKEAVLKLFVAYSMSFATEEAARYVPFIGTLIASSVSFFTTFAMLSSLLDKMAEASIELMEKNMTSMMKKSEYELD